MTAGARGDSHDRRVEEQARQEGEPAPLADARPGATCGAPAFSAFRTAAHVAVCPALMAGEEVGEPLRGFRRGPAPTFPERFPRSRAPRSWEPTGPPRGVRWLPSYELNG
ncbi:hypothetical protein BS78_07G104100 [Paspalum vaginatum]|nr:hypothetical protein BS78_07G104100 [Paspalum vaginatum]